LQKNNNMSLFGLFTSNTTSKEKTKESNLPWNLLMSTSQLDIIEEESKSKVVAIFKYSTRCGISSMAMRQFEKGFNLSTDQVKLYYLDLLSYRDVSKEVGYKFQVLHQSPQLIVIKNGETVAHASHHGIGSGDIERFI
jgi:bacillithiol system protein YtxJ